MYGKEKVQIQFLSIPTESNYLELVDTDCIEEHGELFICERCEGGEFLIFGSYFEEFVCPDCHIVYYSEDILGKCDKHELCLKFV